MSKRTRTIGLLALAGIIAATVITFTFLRDDRVAAHIPDGTVVYAPNLPVDHHLDGEALVDGKLLSLAKTMAGLSLTEKPDALILRLRDAQMRYLDIIVDDTISLSGLAPKTPISVTAAEKIIHSNIPADWNGRIVLDAPDTSPFDISFAQNGHIYHIGITARIGGAS